MSKVDVHLATDIGQHAASEALRTLVEVTGRIPDGATRVIALGLAFAIIEAKADGTRKVFGPGMAAIIDGCRDIMTSHRDPVLDDIVAKADAFREG